jgi:TatD DNase family protein
MSSAIVPLVDFHSHLDLYPDFPKILDECQANNVATLAVTTTPFAYPRNLEAAAGYPLIKTALGLHPQIVGQRHASITEFERLSSNARFIGEVGLDAGPTFYRTFSDQERIFRRIASICAEQGGKVLTVHSVRSAKKVLDILEESGAHTTCSIVFHWFSGSNSDMARALELGCFFSLNSSMIEKPPRAERIKRIPLVRMLTETDGPFRNSANCIPARPKTVSEAVEGLAALLSEKAGDLRLQVWNNAKRLFGDSIVPDQPRLIF